MTFGASMGAVADSLPVSPIVLGAAVILALVIWGVWQYYQFCPHCGALARRVYRAAHLTGNFRLRSGAVSRHAA